MERPKHNFYYDNYKKLDYSSSGFPKQGTFVAVSLFSVDFGNVLCVIVHDCHSLGSHNKIYLVRLLVQKQELWCVSTCHRSEVDRRILPCLTRLLQLTAHYSVQLCDFSILFINQHIKHFFLKHCFWSITIINHMYCTIKRADLMALTIHNIYKNTAICTKKG